MPTRYIVDDVERDLAFYVNALGFEVVEQWGPAFAIVRREDVTLWLSGPQSSAARPMPDGRQPIAGGWSRVVLQVDDAASMAEELRAMGAVLRNDPISGPGGTQVLVEDPSGNPIELFTGRS
jgi:catechol 2,3-dioxygenase-like lactoylglutathione lyase family enzyme